MRLIRRLFSSWLFLILANLVLWSQGLTLLFNPTPPDDDYYVSKTGSNLNPCVRGETVLTKLTIGGATGGLSCLSAGDTLTIKAGTYAEVVGAGVNNIVNGIDADSHTVVQGAAGETVIIRPTTGCTDAFGLWNGREFITLRNLTIDANSVCIVGVGIRHGSHDITMESLIVKNADIYCVHSASNATQDTYNLTIRDSDVGPCGLDTTQASSTAVYFRSSDTLIENNILHAAADGNGVRVAPNATPNHTASNAVIRNNFMYNNGTGVNIAGHDALVYNNVIYDPYILGSLRPSISITAGGEDDAVNPRVSNNTVVGAGTFCVSIQTGVPGTILQNNILLSCPSGSLSNSGTGTVLSNNLCPTGCFVNQSNPALVFTNPGADDYSLFAGSPAIGNGTNLSAVFTTDVEGTTRSVPFDIGAYEFDGPEESITLSTPDGGESWVKTELNTIAWTSANMLNVRIRVDRQDDGVFEETITASTESTGQFDWMPEGTASMAVRLEICDAADFFPCDISAAPFAITDAAGGQFTKRISENTVGAKIGDIPGVEDVTLWSTSPTTNFGSAAINANNPPGIETLTVLRFTGLSQIPANAEVVGVTIGLFLQAVNGGGAPTLDLRKSLRAWVEDQATWNIYSTGNNWQTAGSLGTLDIDSTVLDTFASVGTTTNVFYTSVDVGGTMTQLFQDWVDGSTVNNGLHMRKNGASDSVLRTWTGSEGTNGNRPYVEVSYNLLSPSIIVSLPFGSHVFPGDTIPVRWQTTDISGGLNIYLSRDGGFNYIETLSMNFPLTGIDFAWTVTPGTCNSCMIKVQSVNSPLVVGLSAPFRIGGTAMRIQ